MVPLIFAQRVEPFSAKFTLLVMLTYALMFNDNGCLVDGEEYTSLDQVRDIAFEVSAETNRRIAICQYFGISENIIETVLA